jgi:hypothetical protein
MRWLALAVPLLALFELLASFYVRARAPAALDWAGVRASVAELGEPGDLVVVAPAWSEPLARQVFGDAWFPLANVARVDESGYSHALELSTLGARAPELATWREVARVARGPFLLRRLAQPAPEPALYRVMDQLRPDALAVEVEAWGLVSGCDYAPAAEVSAGGLGGHLALPSARFRCFDDDSVFVGATVLDDARFRLRRCLAARPPAAGVLRLTFAGVPFGERLVGYAGSSYLLARAAKGAIEVRVLSGGELLGRHLARDERGFHRFELSTERRRGTRGDLVFELRGDPLQAPDFCFVAETR